MGKGKRWTGAGLIAAALVVAGAVALLRSGGAGLPGGQAPSDSESKGRALRMPAASSPLTSPTGTASPTLTATATITLRQTATPTLGATAVPTATLDLTPVPEPSLTPEPGPAASSTPTIVNLPYAAQGSGFEPPEGRVWGMQFAAEFDPLRYLDFLRLELPRGRQAGLASIRTTLRWDEVEPSNTTPDRFDWRAADRKLGDYSRGGYDLMVQLVAYPAWATEYQCGGALRPGMEAEWQSFAREAARRYGRAPYRVAAWEIGNEIDGESAVDPDDFERPEEWGRGQPTIPEGGCWGGRAPAYAEFLRLAYTAIKAEDPEVLVTLGGLGNSDVNGWFDMGFLDAFLAAGGGAHSDFIGYHWFANLREVFPNEPTGPDKYHRIRATMAKHGVDKPVWLTETYRHSTVGEPATRAEQIHFLTQELIEVLATTDLERIYWYGWTDFPPDWSPNERGLIGHDHRPKPAFPVLAYALDYSQGEVEDLSTEQVVAYRFRRPRAAGETLIAWSRDGRPARLVLPARGRAPALATWFPAEMLMAGRCCAEAAIPPAGGRYTFNLGADAIFVAIDRPR